MAIIINGKELAAKVRANLKIEVDGLKEKGIFPKLAVIMVGNDSASAVYVRNKSKACNEIGVEFEEFLLPENTTREELLNLIEELNNRKDVNGILLQSPIPKHLDIREAFNAIDYKKDVDGFNTKNIGKLALNQEAILPCTVRGIITILDRIGTSYSGKNVVVIGRSKIVGKPIAYALLNRNCTVTVCHSKTQSIEKFTKDADILIVAAGVPGIINGEMVKPGSIVIDVGINRCNSKIIGDVVTGEVAKVASYVTSVPGGVGLTTVLSLAQNLVEICESRVSFVKN